MSIGVALPPGPAPRHLADGCGVGINPFCENSLDSQTAAVLRLNFHRA